MFQNLASYLLGYSNQTEGGAPAATEGVENNAETRLTAKEAEDDWIFVDQQDGEDDLLFDEELKQQDDSDILVVEDGTEDGCEELDGDYDTIADVAASMASSGGPLMSSTRSLSSLPGAASAVEESWFLTPPRCFISTGPPVNMATSPLENLLIEHPSMSVYGGDPFSSARREPEWFGPISDPSSEAEEEEEEEDDDDDYDLKGEALLLENAPDILGFHHIMDNRLSCSAKTDHVYQGKAMESSMMEAGRRLEYPHLGHPEAKSFQNDFFYAESSMYLKLINLITKSAFNLVTQVQLEDQLPELREDELANRLMQRNSSWGSKIQAETRARPSEFKRRTERMPRSANAHDLGGAKHVDHNKLPEPQFKQVVAFKRAQKVQVKKSRKAKGKGHMDRNNKAREVNCRNHRQRRGERSQGPNRSHANNNRKC